jgi:hypothetical protein
MSGFVDKGYYKAKITRQEVTTHSKDGFPVLNVYCQLMGLLPDARQPDAEQLLECPKVEVMTSLQFNPGDDKKMEFAASDLENLGFTDDDLSRLAEGHKRHFSLKDKVVVISPTTRTYNSLTNVYWNLRFPRQREDRPIAAKELASTKAAQAYREALERRKAEKADGATAGAAGNNVPF